MIRVGKIAATHGIGGTVILTHVAGTSTWLKNGLGLMVEMQKGSYIPYFVSSFKANDDEEYTITLEDIDKVETAKRLVGKHVYVNEDALAAYAKDSPLLWMGFQVTDVNTGILGVMEDVMQTSAQWLGKIIYQEKEILIPLIPHMIKDVNIKSKRLIVELPAGLLDVYLG